MAKTTPCAHFAFKANLVRAYLERAAGPAVHRLKQGGAALTTPDTPRLIAIFDVLDRWFGREEVRSRRLTNAGLELAGADPRLQSLVPAHKAAVRDLFARLAAGARVAQLVERAKRLTLLYDGDFATAARAGQVHRALLDAVAPADWVPTHHRA